MKDRRLPQFVWQGQAAMARVRHCFDGKERQTAVAIYQAMTTLANDQRSLDSFTASRKQIAELSGASIRTVDRYAEAFERVGLLEIERIVDAAGRHPSSYTLLDPGAATTPPPVQPPHDPPVATARPSDVGEEVQQEERQEPIATQSAADAEPQLFEAPPAVQPAKPSDDLDPLIEKVWDHYLTVFGDRPRLNRVLTPPRRATLAGGLKALGVEEDPNAAVEMACRAITGCRDYRRDHPDQTQDISVDAIFKTHPGTKYNRTDFNMRWANYANATVLTSDSSVRVPVDLVGVPSVTAGTIRARRREVAQMFDHPGSAEAKERGEVAVDWLREHVGHQPKVVDGELRGWELVSDV
jgi:hypothetical protein